MTNIVYLVTNEAMPGLVKIGRTTADDPKVRIDQLYTTGVPIPFECALAKRVDDSDAVEKALHRAFRPDRVNPKREFFKIDPEQARAILDVIPGEDVTPTVNEEANVEISEVERSSSQRLRKKKPNLNFTEMGIPPGAVLDPTSGEDTAIVVDERRVRFRDQEMFLTKATQLRENLLYSVRPTPYWLYQGRKLSDIYNETYPLDPDTE